MVSEWAKKLECWETMRDAEIKVPEPLPPEMQLQRSRSTVNGKPPKLTPGDTRTTRVEQSYPALEHRQRERGLDHAAEGTQLALEDLERQAKRTGRREFSAMADPVAVFCRDI